MSSLAHFQSIYDVLSYHTTAERLVRIDEVLAHRVSSVRLVFEDLFDPHNGAACIRTADAMGVYRIDAIEGEIAFELSHRVSQGAHRWASLTRFATVDDAVTTLKGEGFRLLGADLSPDAVPIDTVDFSGPIAVVFGNESNGISPALRERLDQAFTLPMLGFSRSFNISVACAITLTIMRQRGRFVPDMPALDKLRLVAEWLRRDIPGADAILERHGISI